ncbi:MAG: ribosome maturation factor RimM [Candidatus Latescibacterota bacterium]|jgi:16S rRNA processing protein RimM
MTVLTAARPKEIFLGRFVKPFGIKGELKFVGSDDFWYDALGSRRLELRRIVDDGGVERRAVTIVAVRPHGSHYVVRVEGVESRNDAEHEVGGELFIDSDKIDVDPPKEERPYQVVGLTVRTEDGKELGRIRSVIFSAAHPVYDVSGDEGDVMIPAVPEFVISKDDEAGVITIRPIPGLLDG